jgi:hypothetical protein
MPAIIIDHEYHVIELNGRFLPTEILEWLNDTYGTDTNRWFCRFPRLYFLNKQDHLMFLLKWGP